MVSSSQTSSAKSKKSNRKNSKKANAKAKTAAKASSSKAKAKNGKRSPSLTNEALLNAYKNMRTSRTLDEKMLRMLRQGKSFFHIGCVGHEAIQTAAAMTLESGRDWAFPYYRGQSLCLGLGMTPKEVLLSFLARGEDPNSGGRQMPQHYGHKGLNIPSQSSPTGTQFLQAVGCAMATMRDFDKENPGQEKDYAVTIVTAGDGTTSQGDFHEALNWATRVKAPVIFLIEDNGYAISVPVRDQTPGGKVSNLGRGYEGLNNVELDGCNFIESYEGLKEAVAHARRGDGPSMVVADVVRLLPHSSSDDQRKYRSADELAEDKERDPMVAMTDLLIERGAIKAKDIETLEAEVLAHVNESADAAEAAPMPARESAEKWVLSEEPEPDFVEPQNLGQEMVLVDAINRALAEELARNDKMMVFGEDVAGEKGGVFTATRKLTERFGKERVFNSPLAESSIVGVAIGLALRGHKPVVEIQFGDYVWTAMMQIRNELATMRYRSNNDFSAPVVIRIPIGGYIHGALCHSQNIESFFAHIPGLKIALPSTARDAYGLLKAAIRGNDPVLFLEHKGLYRQNYAKSLMPEGDDWILPFGKSNIRREGADISVITYGAMVQRSLQAAAILEAEGVSVEVLDLRSLNPVDWEGIEATVKKTGKILVAQEDCRFVGYGAEIAAEIGERFFEDLDAPVRRLAGKDTPVPFNWDLEEEILPQIHDVTNALRALAAY